MSIANRVAIAGALVLLAGCNKTDTAPKQVVASVDGVEITQGELAFEMSQERDPRVQAEAEKNRNAYLERLVRRKLLLAEAKTLKIDQNPNFLLQMLRQREIALGEIMIDRWKRDVGTASDSEVAKYIAAHPEKFGDRKVIVVDRLNAPANNAFTPEEMTQMGHVEAVLDGLKSAGMTAQRDRMMVDTANAPATIRQQALAQPIGKAVVTTQGDRVYVTEVIEVRPAPIPESQWPDAARAMILNDGLTAFVEDRLKADRAKAKIVYSPGYAAPAPDKKK
ncbi:SurA N-terminal domain-containing protein [Sphingomonas immobilis]|uniref:SurA N-terminal domain-containing protein n=1 Tax=Sphingomonas immobilis TaxID=3063997 RepID=A0ABT9A1I0_9SPHN|nr:SurA N-terminal domain-containing protein [Sphingomonas sp. CA1-15]MDO7843686.1 SurA N-terminal domain-containing protein [Sphingomonas sp. CA1-15]